MRSFDSHRQRLSVCDILLPVALQTRPTDGTVRLEELEGPAGFLYWSWDWTGSWFSLLNPLTWWENLTGKMRWDRMGRFRECI